MSYHKPLAGELAPAHDKKKDNKAAVSLTVSPENLENVFASCDDFEKRSLSGGAVLFWLDGLVDAKAISEEIICPLGAFLAASDGKSPAELLEACQFGAVWACTLRRRKTLDSLSGDITQGCCVLVFPGLAEALSFEVKSGTGRAVSQPTVEKTVKGGKDAFVETLRVNTALVRRRLRNPSLKLLQAALGRESETCAAVLYVEGAADPALVKELCRRLKGIDLDSILSCGGLEQFVTDSPRSPFPQLIHTERPDKMASELLCGRVGLLVDGLPMAFLAPAPLAEFMRVAEDRSQHFITASLLTILRWLAFFAAILLPALLVAVSMYHQEMIPYKFMLSMIEARQKVPFSAAGEMLVMLLAFELLQEAGIRLPNPVGDTVSIIGALIVGQAAVDAQIVSPAAVIVVAASGICGFTQPSQDLCAALRIIRLLMLFAAMALGMYGVTLLLALLLWGLCAMDSFGVSYLSPLSEKGLLPSLGGLLQIPLWREKLHPGTLNTPDKRWQK